MAIGEFDRARAAAWVREVLGVDDPNTAVGGSQIDKLANVRSGTYQVWRTRSARDYTGPGKLSIPMPEPRPELEVPASVTRRQPWPRWRALDDIMVWLWETDRWYIDRDGNIRTAGRKPAAA